MPVLARTLESAGLATILVTMMPFWAEKVGAPRTLAVEFPFAQTLGAPGDRQRQMRVIHQALAVLQSATKPGVIVHSGERWSEPAEQAIRSWQPAEPSPIIALMRPRIRELLRKQRRATKG